MASVAEKLRKKRVLQRQGRPRKQGVPRHPCGKITEAYARQESEREAKEVATAARLRQHGVSDDNGLSGYTLGRIYLDGRISKEQLAAGNAYAEEIARYYRLTGIAFPSARAQELNRINGDSGDITESQAKKARAASNRMMALVGGLASLKNGPQVKSTVHNVCVMDFENLRAMPDTQMYLLRCGLDWLIYEKGLRERGKSDIPSVNQ